MKNIKFYTTALAVFLMSFLLVNLPAVAQQLRGNGNIKTESRRVSNFNGLDVSGGFIVEVTKGSNEGVRLEADENLLDNIRTEVRDGVLHIYNEKGVTTSKAMKAYVTVEELNNLDISGGVKVIGNSTFTPNALRLDASGGSDIKLTLDTRELLGNLSGASKVALSGKAGEVVMDVSGASNVNAADLQASRVKIESSGASKARVYATEALDIDASGASAVYYKGTPSITSETSAAARISRIK
ncbi:putative autotransporter adhesin-like protein [Pontibacter ummariensis]|uniref:Putative auto-transporter adhesin, head GIN domain n=1 Tax=Pontibacter ummariensis TaxID=1610492 RepID=A0A239CHA2_9BACT|nr:head GIN domain-containing protein [Pontibacter ummariensis]PRY15026.1 putative autotransporter adhesin-like protein [Pontibacter ummariensis]SNS19252.1 Putative auto-transporter adhesin, head GIN domain [Pontibacter ummariensis]